MNPSEIADVLDAAADLLEADGWTQGFGINEAGERCAVGAIACARMPTGVAPFDLVNAALAALKAHLGGQRAADWNDTPGRTKYEVIDAFRHAAKDQRNLDDWIDEQEAQADLADERGER